MYFGAVDSGNTVLAETSFGPYQYKALEIDGNKNSMVTLKVYVGTWRMLSDAALKTWTATIYSKNGELKLKKSRQEKYVAYDNSETTAPPFTTITYAFPPGRMPIPETSKEGSNLRVSWKLPQSITKPVNKVKVEFAVKYSPADGSVTWLDDVFTDCNG